MRPEHQPNQQGMIFYQPTVPVVPDPYDLEQISFGGNHGNRLRQCDRLPAIHTAQRQRLMAPSSRQGRPGKVSGPTIVERSGGPRGLFLRTKMLPPRPAPELLSRPRLTNRLLGNLSRPVTLVTANAGSGKTTLVADVLRNHGQPFVWY